jgi:hypothetical protein
MNAPPKLSLNDQIRARDGDKCWLCGGKLDFKAEPNSSKAPTREHLLAQSLGGTNDLAKLVLCHPGCNKQLGIRPVAEKQKMRAKRQDDLAKLVAAQKAKRQAAASAKAQQTSAPTANKTEMASPQTQANANVALPNTASVKTAQVQTNAQRKVSADALRHWQVAAIVVGGLALLFFGFSVGLLVG